MRGRDSFRLGPVTRAVWTQDHVDWAETEGAEALGLGWGGAGAGGGHHLCSVVETVSVKPEVGRGH